MVGAFLGAGCFSGCRRNNLPPCPVGVGVGDEELPSLREIGSREGSKQPGAQGWGKLQVLRSSVRGWESKLWQISCFIVFLFFLVGLRVCCVVKTAWGEPFNSSCIFHLLNVRGRLAGCAGWGSPASLWATATNSPTCSLLKCSLRSLLAVCWSQDEQKFSPWKEFYVSLAVWQGKFEREATSKEEAAATSRYLQYIWVSQSPRFHEALQQAKGQLILSIHKGICDHFTVYV